MAECRTQTTLEEFADTTDSAMVRTAEELSAAIDARKATGSLGEMMQRNESQSGWRDNVLMKSGEARVARPGWCPAGAGDSSHGNGGTRELKATEGVHLPHSKV